jgi:hypothetical protein
MKKKVVFSIVVFLFSVSFCFGGLATDGEVEYLEMYPSLVITEPTEVFGDRVYSRCLIDAPVTIAQINNTIGTGYWNLKCLDYLEITENAQIDGIGRGWRGGIGGDPNWQGCWYDPADGQSGEGERCGIGGNADGWRNDGEAGHIAHPTYTDKMNINNIIDSISCGGGGGSASGMCSGGGGRGGNGSAPVHMYSPTMIIHGNVLSEGERGYSGSGGGSRDYGSGSGAPGNGAEIVIVGDYCEFGAVRISVKGGDGGNGIYAVTDGSDGSDGAYGGKIKIYCTNTIGLELVDFDYSGGKAGIGAKEGDALDGVDGQDGSMYIHSLGWKETDSIFSNQVYEYTNWQNFHKGLFGVPVKTEEFRKQDMSLISRVGDLVYSVLSIRSIWDGNSYIVGDFTPFTNVNVTPIEDLSSWNGTKSWIISKLDVVEVNTTNSTLFKEKLVDWSETNYDNVDSDYQTEWWVNSPYKEIDWNYFVSNITIENFDNIDYFDVAWDIQDHIPKADINYTDSIFNGTVNVSAENSTTILTRYRLPVPNATVQDISTDEEANFSISVICNESYCDRYTNLWIETEVYPAYINYDLYEIDGELLVLRTNAYNFTKISDSRYIWKIPRGKNVNFTVYSNTKKPIIETIVQTIYSGGGGSGYYSPPRPDPKPEPKPEKNETKSVKPVIPKNDTIENTTATHTDNETSDVTGMFLIGSVSGLVLLSVIGLGYGYKTGKINFSMPTFPKIAMPTLPSLPQMPKLSIPKIKIKMPKIKLKFKKKRVISVEEKPVEPKLDLSDIMASTKRISILFPQERSERVQLEISIAENIHEVDRKFSREQIFDVMKRAYPEDINKITDVKTKNEISEWVKRVNSISFLEEIGGVRWYGF